MAVIGVIVTIVLSTNGVAVVLKGLNRAYKVEETRAFIYTRFLSLLMVIVSIVFLMIFRADNNNRVEFLRKIK